MTITGRARQRDFEPETGQSAGIARRAAAVWPTMSSATHSKFWSWNVIMKCREKSRLPVRPTRVRGPGCSPGVCHQLALAGVARGVQDFVDPVQPQALPVERVQEEAVVGSAGDVPR